MIYHLCLKSFQQVLFHPYVEKHLFIVLIKKEGNNSLTSQQINIIFCFL